MRFYDLLQWPTGGMLQPTHIDNCGMIRQFIFMSNFQSNSQPCSHACSETVCHRRKAQLEAKDYTDLLIFGKKDPNISRKQIEQHSGEGVLDNKASSKPMWSRVHWTQWKDFHWFLKILDGSQGKRNTPSYTFPPPFSIWMENTVFHN